MIRQILVPLDRISLAMPTGSSPRRVRRWREPMLVGEVVRVAMTTATLAATIQA